MNNEHLPGAPPPEEEVTTFPEPERLFIHMPVDIRNVSLMVLAGLGLLFVLHWAKAVFIPVMLSVLFSYAFSPVVNWLELRRVPRWLGSAVLLLSILGALGTTAYALSDEASAMVDSLPVAAQKFRNALKRGSANSPSTLDTVQKAATQIEQAAQDSASAVNSRGVMRVVIEKSHFNVKDYLWTGTVGLIALIGQATVVIFLTYFLMLSGDTFRRKMLKLAGPNLSELKITVHAVHEITEQIQRYLQVELLT
ncbi:MAG: AI-2E family transporter, partial [Polaromonas sp.]|nr:AI-2E family transporter [Polaromonas sp.]